MSSSDDTEARFRALIDAEFGPDPVVTTEESRPVVPLNEIPSPRSWEPPEEEEEPFVPPPLAPMRPLSTPGLLALLLLVGSTVVGVLLVARVALPWWAGTAGLVCFVVGVIVAFTRLPRDRDQDADNGAVV